MSGNILIGDCREQLRTLPAGSVHCCVTSPPYWGLRDYGVDGQLGLEQTPEGYVAELVGVFREVWRVLRDDGTLWLNLGDSYAAGGAIDPYRRTTSGKLMPPQGRSPVTSGLKPKDLVGIPWRVAFALQADRWYLRSDIIWSKPNPMPESVTDRPTCSHEYVFLLTKRERYFFDAVAVREKSAGAWDSAKGFSAGGKRGAAGHSFFTGAETHKTGRQTGRNIRSVWTIPTRSFPGSHFATFPPALVEPCVKAGTSERGC